MRLKVGVILRPLIKCYHSYTLQVDIPQIATDIPITKSVDPNVAKAGGLQSQGVKGEIVVGYLDPLTTQDLKSSGFPEG